MNEELPLPSGKGARARLASPTPNKNSGRGAGCFRVPLRAKLAHAAHAPHADQPPTFKSRLLRPFGVVLNGHLQLGLEVLLEEGVIKELRPHTGLPEPYVISPSFVNAHSHLEYRGLQGKLHSDDYFSWIREITEAKKSQTLDQVRESCLLAARENRATGVARIAEHSDRPFASEALTAASIDGVIYQELITFLEQENPREKIERVRQLAERQQQGFSGVVAIGLHSAYTVDRTTLESFGSGKPAAGPRTQDSTLSTPPNAQRTTNKASPPQDSAPSPKTQDTRHKTSFLAHHSAQTSIHVAESLYENQFFRTGEGPIADFYRRNNVPFRPIGASVVAYLESIGLAGSNVQFVHCCDLSTDDIKILADAKVRVAHCPRSNTRLKCPTAPVRELLDAGVRVGLGLDSPASSGPIDMFAEMRAALGVSAYRGKPLTPEEVWSMATTMGNESIGFGDEGWDIYQGSTVPLIKVHIDNAYSTEDLIEQGSPASIDWV